MYKTLGIIGGMGPLATVKLFEKIVLKTKADCDQEHIHILIDNNTKIPDRVNFILGNSEENPKYELIKSAKKLESIGAEFLAMPCNTAHYFYKDIIEQINIPFINMIEITLEFIIKTYPSIKKVGLLSTEGTIKANIYEQIFNKSNIEVLKPNKQNQNHISSLIKNVKQGIHRDSLVEIYEALYYMEELGAEIFIAGCTEISVALDLYNLQGSFVDPLDVLANNIIEISGREIKDNS